MLKKSDLKLVELDLKHNLLHVWKMSISIGGGIEIQTAITKDCQYSCGSEIYCACSSIRQKIWSNIDKAF